MMSIRESGTNQDRVAGADPVARAWPSMTENQRIVAVSAAAASVQGLIALITNANRIFFGTYGPYTVTGMLEIFFRYATNALNGEVPYRDYLVEYPILGFLLFLTPRLLVSDFFSYRIAYGLQLLLFNSVAVFVVARRVARTEGFERVPSRLAWYTAFFASLCPLLMGPYDLAPMAVAFLAAHLWFTGRNGLGGIAAGLGFLLKIFPGVVAAPAVLWEVTRLRESRGRGFLAFVATLAAGMAFWLWIGGRGVADSFRYHAERGLQVESLYAGVLMLIGKATGKKVTWAYDHSALHITADWGDSLAQLSMLIQLAAILLVLWRYRRSGMNDGVRYAGAAVLGFMATGKVLSPQFLTWLIPFVTVMGGEMGRRARWIYLLACIATTLIYPLIGLRLILDLNNLGGMFLLNYRNALLLGLFFLLLFGKDSNPERTVPLASNFSASQG
jgi:hypothetical protein